jgi:hypothetical protein
MAFNMNRPIIKGTSLHKASIAKAKSESIVSQARVSADSSLVGAGELLGESYIPAAIDFSIDRSEPTLTKKDLENHTPKVKNPKVKKEKEKVVEKTPGPAITLEDIQQSNKDAKIDTDKKAKNSEKKKVKTKVKKNKKKKKYIEEAEDEDIIVDDGRNNEATVHPNKKDRGYKNWKVKEEEKNIADAEANKKRLNEASAKRVADAKAKKEDEASKKRAYESSKKALEADSADEDNDYSGIENNNSDPTEGSTGTQNKPYENWKAREQERNIAAAEANKAKLDAESKARKNKASKIEPKNIDKLPTTLPEGKLEQAGPAPEAKPGKGKAHENPDYETKRSTKNSEGQITSLGGTPVENPGYSYNEESDQWTYNDILVEPHEVPEEFVDGVDAEREESDNINLNSNTPSNNSTRVDLLPQPQPQPVEAKEATTTPDRKPKPSDFEGSFKERQEQYRIANEEWYQAQQAKKGKSPMEMRDDRIYRNARADGPVRENMIKSGYKPQ